MVQLTFHLRHLLSLLSSHVPPAELNYRRSTEATVPLSELVSTTVQNVGVLPVAEGLYSLLLLKKIILTAFELLCVSLELTQDIQYSYAQCKDICTAIEEFNQLSPTVRHQLFSRTKVHSQASQSEPTGNISYFIKFADLVDVYITSHVKLTASHIIDEPSLESILLLSRFESSFSWALLGLVATYTSLLKTSIRKLVYVSEEMFSVNLPEGSEVSWSDCLMSGFQSDLLRVTCLDIQTRLWGGVAERLIASVQPVLTGAWAIEKLVPQLTKASQHAGYLHYYLYKYINKCCLLQIWSPIQLLSVAFSML